MKGGVGVDIHRAVGAEAYENRVAAVRKFPRGRDDIADRRQRAAGELLELGTVGLDQRDTGRHRGAQRLATRIDRDAPVRRPESRKPRVEVDGSTRG